MTPVLTEEKVRELLKKTGPVSRRPLLEINCGLLTESQKCIYLSCGQDVGHGRESWCEGVLNPA